MISRDSRLPGNLPQYGFGPEAEFKNLVDKNVFLFRVHTPKSPTLPDQFFTALRFDGRYTSNTSSPAADPLPPTYADIIRHMDWSTRHSSPYVSTSFSLMWAVWEALRRYHFGLKHDVEIAVIDASSVAGRCTTVVEVLRSAGSKERHENHWKWYRFAHESQSVLVYGAIPQYSVIASIPILRIIDNLPSYCLRQPSAIPPKAPIDRVAWTYPIPKPNYRTFCEAQAATFLQASPEARFRDSTAGSVRLSLVFLTAWFHWMLQLHPPPENDSTIFYDAAVTKISELAHAIALWPAASETIEIWDSVIREIALLVAEHVEPSRPMTGAEIVPGTPPAPTRDDNFGFSGDVSIPAVLDPRNYLPTPPPTPPPALMAPFPRAADRSFKPHPSALSPPHLEVDTGADKCLKVSDFSHSQIDSPAPTPPPSPRTEKPETVAAEPPPEVALLAPAVLDVHESSAHPGLHSMGETASCLLTGFFFGALIIIVLSQRRPTLIHLS